MQIIEDIEERLNKANHEDVEGNPTPARSPVHSIGNYFDENDPEWEFYLERVAEASPLSIRSFTTHLQNQPAVSGPIEEMSPEAYGLESRWRMLFTLCKNHLHSGRFNEGLEILEKYVDRFTLVDDDFRSRGTYLHLRAEILRNIGGEENLREAFELAIDAHRHLTNHPGAGNNIGEIILISFSEDIPISDILYVSQSQKQLIQFGVDLLETAIEKHPEIPTYHATLGRLYSQRGDFRIAREQINMAIRLANPDRDRFNTRLSQYQRFLSQTKLQHQTQELDRLSSSIEELDTSIQEKQSEIDNLQRESESKYQKLESKYNDVLRDFQTRNLQFIGFFAALIAVIISVVNISISMPYSEAAGLILLLIGGILLAFAGLLNVLPSTESDDNGIREGAKLNGIVGVLLIIAGLVAPYFI